MKAISKNMINYIVKKKKKNSNFLLNLKIHLAMKL